MNQIGLFLRIYINPHRAFGRVIDEGRLAFAIALAILAVLAVQVPRHAQMRSWAAQAQQHLKQRPAAAPAPAPKKGGAQEPASDGGDEEEEDVPAGALSAIGPVPIRYAVDEFTGFAFFHYFPPVISLALCFVPAALLVVTLWDSLGRFTTVLFRDYVTLLVCGLMAWAAAYLPLGIALGALVSLNKVQWVFSPLLWWAASAYFLVLCAFAIRTLMGATALHAAGAAAGGWAAGVAGVWLHSISGSITWYLASPCVLYYLWASFQPSVYSLGYGFRSRQRLKQMLETATINPRDADAHLQLGLIYMQRRQYEPAIERFQKTIEIDPGEADAWFQLGRIAHIQGRYADALSHCQAAARLNDKLAASEVWREIGALQFRSGRLDAARYALEKFVARREYDPEGQCWYGRTLAALGDREAARRAFQEAMDAARTMPAPRRSQVRTWAAQAAKELRALKSPARLKAQAAPAGAPARAEGESA